MLVVSENGQRRLQTVPHSPVGYAVEAGVLDEREAICHQDLHLVSNLLGVDTAEIEFSDPLQLAPSDTVVIASDGLFDNLLMDDIVENVCRGALMDVALNLVEETLRHMIRPDGAEPSKPDDLALILYRSGE